ncbi:MAG: phosphoenolpyruvate--protein phosphotransferase [Candidatus Omnitrophica bacterium]|nr:phosphoenolpyruvate--protein phosphotransferase [Candidatus Omnitrophota bacterium]
MLKGIPAAPGVAVGKAYLFDRGEPTVSRSPIAEDQIPKEIARFEQALTTTRHQILEIQKRLAEEIGQEHAEIFNAHLLVLEDRTMIEEIIAQLNRDRIVVEAVFSDVIKKYMRAFAKVDDEYLRERTADIEAVRKRVLRNLLGTRGESPAELREQGIVVAYDLSPSDTAQMQKEHVLAIVTDIGGRTSHTAIMAKSLEIPAVVGLENATREIHKGDLLIIDGAHGEVVVNPDHETLQRYERERLRIQQVERDLVKLKDLSAETLDGHRLTLSANIEFPGEVDSVIAHGADGIGLYRTEFIYLNRTDLPTEEEHYRAYRSVAERIQSQPVIIRTLDLGGDKFASHLQIPNEMNPFMGWRAIRFCLARPDIFKVQLRAILRASAYGKLKMMYPMISGVEELRQAQEMLRHAQQELRQEGIPFDARMEVGAMIEVPSAALTCDILAKEVSFFSIGTNDLIQYALAVDRVNEKIAYLYDPAHPAVLRLIKQIIDIGHANNIWVGMCGEMAGEPVLGLLLLGLGLDEFSTSPVLVPEIKKVIRSVEWRWAQQVAQEALTLPTGREVEAFARAKLKELLPEWVK